MNFPNDLPVRFTNHALDRLPEAQVTVLEAIDLLIDSFRESPPNKKYKREKYGNFQETVSYWRSGTIIFTLSKQRDNKTGEHFYLVLTVTNQLATLRSF